MAPLEILASLHDGFVRLLTALVRRSPTVVVRAVARARGGLPHGVVHERHASFEIPGLVRRAHRRTVDLLITIDDPDGKVLFALMLELQNSVVVVWPEHVEAIVSLDRARTEPLATIFAGLYHACADEPIEDRVAGIRATLVALMNLDLVERQRYGVLVSLTVPKPLIERAEEGLRDVEDLTAEEARWAEDVMEFIRGNWAYGLGVEEGSAEARRRGLEEGRREGMVAGRREGLERGVEEGRCRELRRALLDFLAFREVATSAVGRADIESCGDVGQLEHWYELAKAAPADELTALFG